MNREEATNLLAVAQTYDQRTVGQTDVMAWFSALGDLPFSESRDAMVTYYATNTTRVMPAHIRQLLLAARQDRAMRALSPARSDLVPMPSWFRTVYEKSLAESRAAGSYAERGPLAASMSKLADGGW